MKIVKETTTFKILAVDSVENGIEIVEKAEDKLGNTYFKPLFKVGTDNPQDKAFLQLFKELLGG